MFRAILSWHAPIGLYIGTLALLGVVVPLIRDIAKMSKWSKAAWTVVFFALMVLEVRTLYQDRDQHEQEQEQTRASHDKELESARVAHDKELQETQAKHDEEQTGIRNQQIRDFRRIEERITAVMISSQNQFNETMKRTGSVLDSTQTVGKLAQKNLMNVTGGNSYAFLVPQNKIDSGPVQLQIVNDGDEILSGVMLEIMHEDGVTPLYEPMAIGSIAPHSVRYLKKMITPKVDKDDIDAYWIEISAQNGTVIESLAFRASKKGTGFANTWNVERLKDMINPPDFGQPGHRVPMLLKNQNWSDEP